MTTRSSAGYMGPNLVVHGRLSGTGELVVDGKFEGDMAVEGHVSVGPKASIVASLSVGGLTVAGRVRGHVTAMDEVMVSEGGQLTGDVRAASVGIEDGGALHGEIIMDFELPDHDSVRREA